MYSEELDWCRRAVRRGGRSSTCPTAEIVHYEGKSSEQVVAARAHPLSPQPGALFPQVPRPRRGETLRLALLGMFAVEWLLEAGKWLLGSKRPLRRERMAAYGQLLASGLR